jgi:hypothetical protein
MELKSELLSEPVFNGLWGGSKIRGGIDVDIAKSAMQKAIRRGDVSLAWTMALRLNEFVKLGKGKAVRTNMLNRLPVIAGEDIGMGNLKVVIKVEEYVNMFRDSSSENLCEAELVDCITMMCLAKKSRLGSHVNAVFYQALSTPEYFEKLDPLLLETMKNIERKNKILSDDEDKFLVARIEWLLRNAKTDMEKMSTFFYMRYLLNSENKYKIPRGYPKKRNISSEPIFFVWNIMMTIVKPDRKKSLEICYKMFLNENERHIYLVLGLFVYFFYDEVNSEKMVDVSKTIESFGGLEKIIFSAMNEVIEIPEYAVDKHTKKGRSKGKDSVVFAVEGAVVENESEWISKIRSDGKSWKNLGEMYIDFRKFCPKFNPRLKVDEIIKSWFDPSTAVASVTSVTSVTSVASVASVTSVASLEDGTLNGKSEKSEKSESEKSESESSAEEGSLKKKVVKKKGSRKGKKVEEENLSWDAIVSVEMRKEVREKLLRDDTPRGQVLTSRWKKYVYMPLDESFVYKGPWRMGLEGTPKEKEKLRKLKFRFDVCELMNANVLKGEVCKDDEKNLWLKYPTLGGTPSNKWKSHLIKDKITEKEIRVVDKTSLGLMTMAYSVDKVIDRFFFEKNLYCDFLLLYVLGVGDTGLYNVLVNSDESYIIDIDDDTTKTEFVEIWDIFGRKPAERIVDILKLGVKKNKEKIRSYLEDLENKIDVIVKLGEKNGLNMEEEELKKRVVNVKKIVLK